MMVRAKELLEASGYEVVGGEIAITKQKHIVNSRESLLIDDLLRNKILSDDEWQATTSREMARFMAVIRNS